MCKTTPGVSQFVWGTSCTLINIYLCNILLCALASVLCLYEPVANTHDTSHCCTCSTGWKTHHNQQMLPIFCYWKQLMGFFPGIRQVQNITVISIKGKYSPGEWVLLQIQMFVHDSWNSYKDTIPVSSHRTKYFKNFHTS